MVLDGMVPVLTQTPPSMLGRSTIATRRSSFAAAMAAFWPPGPDPITRRSKSCTPPVWGRGARFRRQHEPANRKTLGRRPYRRARAPGQAGRILRVAHCCDIRQVPHQTTKDVRAPRRGSAGGPRPPRHPWPAGLRPPARRRRTSRRCRRAGPPWSEELLGGDAQTHHPAPLGDATVADESELFEQAFWPSMQVGATLRVTSSHLLRVGLDQASASLGYRGQHRGNSGPRHAFAAEPGAGKQAADPPVGQLGETLFIGPGVLDASHLGRWPVLAPAGAATVTVDEHLVDGAVVHMSSFGLAVACRGAVLADSPGMKADTPAATPDTVVRLDQCGEVIPGTGREQARRVLGHSRCHSPALLSCAAA